MRALPREHEQTEARERTEERDFRDLSVNQLARFFELAPDAILGVRHGGEIAFVNGAAREMFALPADPVEPPALWIEDLLPDSARTRHAHLRETFERRPWRRPMGATRDLLARRLDGTPLAVEVSLAPVATMSEMLTVAAVRDVSERRERARRERRAAEVQAMLAEANEILMHGRRPAEVCLELCRAVARSGGFLLCWVGLVAGDAIVPAAAAGAATGELPMRLDRSGDGPVARAIRLQQPVVDEAPEDPLAKSPLSARLVAAGLRSGCAVPITRGNETVGGLGLWSGEPGFFAGELLAACEQLAVNLSLALDRLASAALQADVARLGRLALAGGEVQTLLDEAAESATRLLGGSRCHILERREDGTWSEQARHETRAHRAGVATDEPAGTTRRHGDKPAHARVPIADRAGVRGEIELAWDARHVLADHEAAYLSSVAHVLGAAMGRDRIERRLEHLALHDPLTGLPNRVLLLSRLSAALARRSPGRARPALLFVDLDRFKFVNDALGHSCGDELLLAVSRRLGAAIGSQAMAARIGGDEFAVLCPAASAESATALARAIVQALAAPVPLGGGSTFVTASIGVALARDGLDANEMLQEADAAMYEAKAKGRDRFAVFDDELRAQARHWLEVETDLRRALRDGELTARYQPVHRLDGTVVGLEALVRWRHSEHGVVAPRELVALAESTGRVLELGDHLLQVVCAQLADWRSSPALASLRVALDLSALQLADRDLAGRVEAALADHGVPASALTVEIGETALMHDVSSAARTLAALRALGVRIAIDDFGAGYSLLHYLERFPVDAVKIDRRFVSGIDTSAVDLAVVRSVTDLARALGLVTVAEGVERAGQLARARSVGCDLAQGPYWSPPLAPDQVEALVATVGAS